MKRIFSMLLLGALALAVQAEPAVEPAFLLHFPEQLSGDTANRFETFFNRNTDLPAAVTRFAAEDDYLDRAAGIQPTPVMGHIVLLPKNQAGRAEVLQAQSNAVVAVYLEALKSHDEQQYLQRVERYLLRAAATLGGLPDCPQPRCARCVSIKQFGVDNLGLNTCPPCRLMLVKKAGEQGVTPLDPLRFVPDELRQKLINAQKKDRP